MSLVSTRQIDLQTMCDFINRLMSTAFPSVSIGSAYVSTDPQTAVECFGDGYVVPPGDQLLLYDWTLDELTDDQRNLFYVLHDHFFDSISLYFSSMDDHDGSGGGLVYGAVVLSPGRTQIS